MAAKDQTFRILFLCFLVSWARIGNSFSLYPARDVFLSNNHGSLPKLPRRSVAAFGAIGQGDVNSTVDTGFSPSSTESLGADLSPSLDSSLDAPLDVPSLEETLPGLRDSHADDATTAKHHLSEEPFFASAVEPLREDTALNVTSVKSGVVSRRELFQQGALLIFTGAAVGGAILNGPEVVDRKKPTVSPPMTTGKAGTKAPSKPGTTATKNKPAKGAASTSKAGRIAPVNLTQVAAETNINVSLDCDKGCVSVDSQNFTKIQTKKVPTWYPAFLIPPPKVVKEITNGELLAAATVAGATTEIFRTSLLYPLQTIKTRIQTDVHNFTARPPRIEDRLTNLGKNIRRHVREGDLYAGITPSLLISVPATGVYFGIRDVCKRTLAMVPFLNDVEIVLIAALVADVFSLCFRTPADALALRLQDQKIDVGDWVGDSYKRLPGVIITDLPYLLSKVFLGRQFIHGNLSIDRYAEYAIISAVVAAFLTTPFDVARTRILIDSDGDSSNGIDGGSGEGVIRTMMAITKEGRGGVANLFAGWLERTLYLGIGRAWLEPIQIIAYVGIRDWILLDWFK